MFPPPSRRGASSGARLPFRLSSALSSSASPVVLCALLCASGLLLVILASYLPSLLLPLLGVSASSAQSVLPAFSPLSASALSRAAVSAAASTVRSAASLPSILEWRPPSSAAAAGKPAAPLAPPVPAAPQPRPAATGPSPSPQPAAAAAAAANSNAADTAWREKAEAIKAGFVHAYSKYEAKCFGQDEYRPVSANTYTLPHPHPHPHTNTHTHTQHRATTRGAAPTQLCSALVSFNYFARPLSGAVCVSCRASATTGWAPLSQSSVSPALAPQSLPHHSLVAAACCAPCRAECALDRPIGVCAYV